jgi:phosphoribosylformylglycinamidine cyclo-ligase
VDRKLTYQNAGVNISNADDTKKEMVGSMVTKDNRVLNKPGAFASLFVADFPGITNPVLVLKAEEPGSKQQLAFQYGRVNHICADLVNHLVNDIIVMGAKPEVVLDIILCGAIEKEVVLDIVKYLAQACRDQGCSLIGGETSEQPNVLPQGSYMLNASILGVVDREHIIDGSKIKAGDVVLALASNGLHTNGYSLVRKLIEEAVEILEEKVDGETFLDVILRPHKCYYHPLKDCFMLPGLRGLAHITGGGIEGNLNRILPLGMDALIDLGTIEIPAIFSTIQSFGNVDHNEMLRTFNMGVGMTVVADPAIIPKIREHLDQYGCPSFVIGSIAPGNQQVRFQGKLLF